MKKEKRHKKKPKRNEKKMKRKGLENSKGRFYLFGRKEAEELKKKQEEEEKKRKEEEDKKKKEEVKITYSLMLKFPRKRKQRKLERKQKKR